MTKIIFVFSIVGIIVMPAVLPGRIKIKRLAPFLVLTILGALMNILVMSQNNWKMPVEEEVYLWAFRLAKDIGQENLAGFEKEFHDRYVIETSKTKLAFLDDRIKDPLGPASLGDCLGSLGALLCFLRAFGDARKNKSP